MEKVLDMKKHKYKYIYFYKIEDVFICKSLKDKNDLGIVKWYGPWRQYCFFPGNNTIFNKGCMDDIKDFINKIS